MEMEVELEKTVLLTPVDAVAKNSRDSKWLIPYPTG